MLSHGIIHTSHAAGLLSLIDDVTKAKLVQVAKNKGDLEFCKGHLDHVLALLLFNQLKLTTLNKDNT
jgi:hypothetical protein